MDHQEEQQFYKLLRLSLGLTQEFPVEVDADGWRRLYQTAIRQSLVGVCYQGVCLLPEGSKLSQPLSREHHGNYEKEKSLRTDCQPLSDSFCRDYWTRTSDLAPPRRVRYQLR